MPRLSLKARAASLDRLATASRYVDRSLALRMKSLARRRSSLTCTRIDSQHDRRGTSDTPSRRERESDVERHQSWSVRSRDLHAKRLAANPPPLQGAERLGRPGLFCISEANSARTPVKANPKPLASSPVGIDVKAGIARPVRDNRARRSAACRSQPRCGRRAFARTRRKSRHGRLGSRRSS